MRIFITTPRGRCASCEGVIPGSPVFRMDEAYCCIGCAEGGPCSCSYEADLGEDGVDRLGLPFAAPLPASSPARERLVTGGITRG